jgi:ketosteroid isomerase-like protein
MTDNPHVKALQTAYARWHDSKGASVDTWMAMLADDIKFGTLASSSQSSAPPAVAPTPEYLKPCDTKQAWRGYFEGLTRDWSMIPYTVDEYVADGDVVFARGKCSFRNKATGKAFETPKVDYWRFKNGRVVEYYKYYDTAGVLGATVR